MYVPEFLSKSMFYGTMALNLSKAVYFAHFIRKVKYVALYYHFILLQSLSIKTFTVVTLHYFQVTAPLFVCEIFYRMVYICFYARWYHHTIISTTDISHMQPSTES